MSEARFSIAAVRTKDDFLAIADLFRGYAASLDVDLSYQNFHVELATLPGEYAPPTGELLLARSLGGQPLACVGLRPLFGHSCEMKRLYVLPHGRGLGLGRVLVDRIIKEAERIGYGDIRLDTLPSMRAAMALYATAGFAPVAAYYNTPVAGTVFLGRLLQKSRSSASAAGNAPVGRAVS